MRRILISFLFAAGMALTAGTAGAQYVSQPGTGPEVDAGTFENPSAEVQGQQVERGGEAARRSAAVQAADLAGESEGGASNAPRFFLALTGIGLVAMALMGSGLIGGGGLLRRLGKSNGSNAG
jgi:hypothetical protein